MIPQLLAGPKPDPCPRHWENHSKSRYGRHSTRNARAGSQSGARIGQKVSRTRCFEQARIVIRAEQEQDRAELLGETAFSLTANL
jgi:hypothetical protein